MLIVTGEGDCSTPVDDVGDIDAIGGVPTVGSVGKIDATIPTVGDVDQFDLHVTGKTVRVSSSLSFVL